ncbi:polyamine ABC transporter substrate-binding protein [Rhodoplanes sp. Z2-YC6860]|uniref:polyamine ABC transporter substrate-binding protein n=1 Tax=Rhodoplanes sp. Z2-YC6860 TaxID=674703 RepID=UPI0018DC0F4B|nr:ABC transporter substrate-binding protein [Rhodoplanes sp. Z2-YC6860]
MGRRDFIKALAAAAQGSALVSALGGLSLGGARAAETPVTAFVFGGAWKRAAQTAFGDPFTAKTGIPMQYQEPYSFARVRAMHEAKAQQIDVFSAQGAEILLANRSNMLMPIDFNIVDRSQLSASQLRAPNVVGSYTLSMVICYNKKKWPGDDHPRSWADFWNVDKFPGRRAVRRAPPIWTIDAALKADGVKEEGFYPLDIDRAFRSLDRIKPHVKAWWSDNAQAQQLMEQEEVDLITMMNGRATESINNGAPFAIVWNEAITESDRQGWVVPVGSPNPSGAMRFIDFVARPEPQAAFARLLYYAPLNSKAFDLLAPEVATQLPTHPDNLRVAHLMNAEWWADNYVQVQRRMERWLQS